jgi:hypothetical protein
MSTTTPHAPPTTALTRTPAPPPPQVHAHEGALNRRVRAAIATMAALRRITLVTSPDSPSRFASGLLVLTRLPRLAVLRVGLGFGAMDALRKLHGCVGRARPGCRFEMLSDIDRLLEEEEGAGKGGALKGAGEEDEAGDEEAGDAGGAGPGGAVVHAAAAVAASAGRVRGPQYVRLVRASWGG